jgi:hypothetical protein
MKKILFLLAVLFSIQSFSQETKFKEYSYTEFFKLIEEEKDTIFSLENAIIKINPITDNGFLITQDEFISIATNRQKFKEFEVFKKINKEINLNNVQFKFYNRNIANPKIAIIKNIEFLKPVSFINVTDVLLQNIRFNSKVSIEYTKEFKELDNYKKFEFAQIILFDSCLFNNSLGIFKSRQNKSRIQFNISNSLIKPQKPSKIEDSPFPLGLQINFYNSWSFGFSNNQVEDYGTSRIFIDDVDEVNFSNNTFTNPLLLWLVKKNGNLTEVINNHFEKQLLLELTKDVNSTLSLDYKQFNKNLFTYNVNSYFLNEHQYAESDFKPDNARISNRNINFYIKHVAIENEFAYKKEQKLKAELYNLYKQTFDNDFANLVYIDMKDLETKRLEYLYSISPSFDTFFTWKINQFLKVFSAYGTKPSKAVIFSMYVILLFAFIYLLFPNSWDSHGRKRIMNRYAFFFKYMNKKSGIHEVYLDNQKEDLLEFDEFKALVAQQGKTVPKFFTATALPLYKWAISGTKLSAGILKRVDIMKGTWSDLPKSKRIWKSILLIGAFSIAVIYDILIKMLNALMLSINTFTTLGFGEIPIKGLPRYLAIIQGFIGWFMLTIFSVSLISQLLN